jgi:hypothetical protein
MQSQRALRNRCCAFFPWHTFIFASVGPEPTVLSDVDAKNSKILKQKTRS